MARKKQVNGKQKKCSKNRFNKLKKDKDSKSTNGILYM